MTIRIRELSKKDLDSKQAFNDWEILLYSLSIENFNNVPRIDIVNLLNETIKGSAILYIIYDDHSPCGFAAALLRSMSLNNKKIHYIVLDVGYIQFALRGNGVLSTLAIKTILRNKFFSVSHFVNNLYVLAMCMTPITFSMYSFPPLYSDMLNSPEKNKKIVDAILSHFCREFNLEYTRYDKPIFFNTWTPKYDSLKIEKITDQMQFFIKQNPNWKKGYALPLVFPMNLTNLIKIIYLLIFKKIFSFYKKIKGG